MMTMRSVFAAGLIAFASACTQQPSGEPAVMINLGEDGDIAPLGAPVSDESIAQAPTPIASDCTVAQFEQVELTHCIADPDLHQIQTALAPRSGADAGTLAGWATTLDGQSVNGAPIAFAMNAGMYGDDLRAIGYFVRGGERLRELNSRDDDGNFYLKPNGVFFGTGANWQILSADAFLRTVRDRPQFGTQSGPMLLIDGALHPEISENGPSRAIRNGVGIGSDGKAHFVIAQSPLSFGQLARFFRDELDVKNALYLDGGPASNLWDPATDRQDTGRVGPLLVVTKKATQ